MTEADDAVLTERNGVTSRYWTTDGERILSFERDGVTAAIAVTREGYGMLMVRRGPTDEELERYYGLDMALDHVAERLGVSAASLPVPDPAADMGM